jgi:methylmalonyl-CoA mutase cobalamin-binding subunit
MEISSLPSHLSSAVAKTRKPYCVINVSTNPVLRDTRFRLLATAGISVVSVSSAQAAEGILTSKDADAIVICSTITSAERERLARLARQKGVGVLVIAAVAPLPASQFSADAVVERLEDPGVFLSKVVEVLEKRAEGSVSAKRTGAGSRKKGKPG